MINQVLSFQMINLNQFIKFHKFTYIKIYFINQNFKIILCQFVLSKCFGNPIDSIDQTNRSETQININNSNNTIYKQNIDLQVQFKMFGRIDLETKMR